MPVAIIAEIYKIFFCIVLSQFSSLETLIVSSTITTYNMSLLTFMETAFVRSSDRIVTDRYVIISVKNFETDFD